MINNIELSSKAISLLAGTLFGLGLAASGMTDTQKVIGFLDITRDWKPELILVMASALAVFSSSFYWIKKRSSPIFAQQFFSPSASQIDKPLLIGASLFGIGWGLLGYCPGPAIAALAYGQWETVVFLLAMLAGMSLSHYLKPKLQ